MQFASREVFESSSRNKMIRLLISFLLVFGAMAHECSVHAQDDSGAGDVDSSSKEVRPDRGHRTSPPHMRSPDERRGGGRAMRRMTNPSEADIDSFILVASDIKPMWKESLGSLRAEDPARFQETLRGMGRKIWYLVELKAQNPSLYKLRIEEIKNDEQLWKLAAAHREEVDLGESESANQILVRLKELALIQVDLKLRVRAEELAAMASALVRLRGEVLMDLEQRQARADQLVEHLLSGKRPPALIHRRDEIRQFMESSSGPPPRSKDD